MTIVDRQKEQAPPSGSYEAVIQITRPLRKFFGRIANIGIENYGQLQAAPANEAEGKAD